MKHFLQIFWARKKNHIPKTGSSPCISSSPLVTQWLSRWLCIQILDIFLALFHFWWFFLRSNFTFLQHIPCKDSWRLTLIRDCAVFIILITFLCGIIVVLQSAALNINQGYMDYLIDSVGFTQVYFPPESVSKWYHIPYLSNQTHLLQLDRTFIFSAIDCNRIKVSAT